MLTSLQNLSFLLSRRAGTGQPGHALRLLIFLAVAGCAGPPPLPGEPVQSVEAKMGRPTNIYPLGQDTLLEYANGPFGQTTYMARIGADGKLVSLEQVLTDAKFGTIRIGLDTKQDVLHTLGRPYETSYLALSQLEVWSYRYKQSNVWDSMMYVHFDHSGVVRKMMGGPDTEREEHGWFR